MGLPHETTGKEKGSNCIKIKKVVPIYIKGTTFLCNQYYLFLQSVVLIPPLCADLVYPAC